MLVRVMLVSLIGLLASACGAGDNCVELDRSRKAPTDFPVQPEIEALLATVDVDDGSSLTRKVEAEFNNNIQDATPVAGTWPLLLSGTLANGANYVVDSDYFEVQAKAGQRIGLWAYKGTWSASDERPDLTPGASFEPRIAVVDALGRRLEGSSRSVPGVGSYVGVEFPASGTYYIEISDLGITETTYSYDYVVRADPDQDMDGLGDAWEAAIDSDPDAIDSDDDGLDDFSEVYWFLALRGTFLPDANVWDRDDDGIPNVWDVDSDGDGIPDGLEGLLDPDADRWPAFLDDDANGDGIADFEQTGDFFNYPADQDRDNIPDFMDQDVDGDGVPNYLDKRKKPTGEACSVYEKQEANNIYDDHALYVGAVAALVDGVRLPEVAVANEALEVLGRGFNEDTRVLFPTATSAIAVPARQVSEDGIRLVVSVPAAALSGPLHALDADRLSNGYEVLVVDAHAPLITDVTPVSAVAGDTVQLTGRNLAGGDVRVYFAGLRRVTDVVATGTDELVSVLPPATASSGQVYVTVDGVQSNQLDIDIRRSMTINAVVPERAVDLDGELILESTLESQAFDTGDFSTDMMVSAADFDVLTIFGTEKDDRLFVIYDALVLPGDEITTIDANSTAIKALFDGLGYLVTQPMDVWPQIREILEEVAEVKSFAEVIQTQVEKNPKAYAAFTDSKIVKAYKKAVLAGGEAVASALQLSETGLAPVVPEFDPESEQYDIYLKPIKESDLLLQNDTKLFLSARVETVDGTEIKKHITHPWSSNMIGPQGWGLFFVSTDVEVLLGGRDARLDVATSGVRAPRTYDAVHGYLVARLLLDGIVLPVLNEYALKRLLGQKMRSQDAADVIIDLIGPQNWNAVIQSVISNPNGAMRTIKKRVFDVFIDMFLNSCLQFPPGTACEKFAGLIASRLGLTAEKVLSTIAKRVSVGVAAAMTPIVNKIIASWETISNANTFGSIAVSLIDLGSTPGTVSFDVDYPLEVEDVRPACYVRNEENPESIAPLLITGRGFLPVPDGLLWWKKDIYPEVLLAGESGTITAVRGTGTSMLVKWPDASFFDGEYNIVVRHQGQEVESEDAIKLVSSGIYLESLTPDAGPTGAKIVLEGCGFSKVASENQVSFASADGKPARGVVISATETALTVIVPPNAQTGDVQVRAGDRESGTLTYTVEEANVTITYGDCGSANDDTFALYADGGLISSMPSPSRPFPVQANLSAGRHSVSLVGITAPDEVGTYCIEFSSNVTVLGGASLSGDDLTAGVRRSWQINVEAPSGGGASSKPAMIENQVKQGLPG